MIKVAFVLIALGFLYLGVRIFIKFREIASWKSDDDLEGEGSASSIPHDLRELRIEEPGSEPGSPDGIDEKKSDQT
jgi:hypothetical protein